MLLEKAEDLAGSKTSHWGLKAKFAILDRWADADDCSVREKAMRVEADFVEVLQIYSCEPRRSKIPTRLTRRNGWGLAASQL